MDGSGVYSQENPSQSWTKKESEIYATKMANFSNASPVIIGDRVFICEEPAKLICINKNDGKVIWQKEHDYLDMVGLPEKDKAEVNARLSEKEKLEKEKDSLNRQSRKLRKAEKTEETKKKIKAIKDDMKKLSDKLKAFSDLDKYAKPKTHGVCGYSSYTPVSNGKVVVAAFGYGIVCCYTIEGELKWKKFIVKPDHRSWGGSTSPRLIGDKVIVRFKEYLALDLNTGKEIWKTKAEQTFGTPAVFKVEGKPFLFTPRGEVIDAETGKQLHNGLVNMGKDKSCATYNIPVIGDGTIFTVRGHDKTPAFVFAYSIPKSIDELKKNMPQLWNKEVTTDRYYASPVYHKGKLFVLSRNRELVVLDAKTGNINKKLKVQNLKGTAYPSLTIAGEQLFVSDDQGNTAVFAADQNLKLNDTHKTEAFRSSLVFAENKIYLRAQKNFYCLSSK